MTNIRPKHDVGHTTEKRLRCIVVDDERRARDTLKPLLARYAPFIDVIAESDSVQGAIATIREESPDIVFLDIEIIGGTGFDVLSGMDTASFITVFITAHEQYREDSRRFPNTRFLVKPVSIEELKDALVSIRDSDDSQPYPQSSS